METNKSVGIIPVRMMMFLCLVLGLVSLLATAGCGGSSTTLSTGSGGSGGSGGGGGGGNAIPCTFTPSGPGGSTVGGAANPVQNQFFGMHINSPEAPWPFFIAADGSQPALPFGTQRLWASGVAWSQIDTVQGQPPDFTLMDQWLSQAQSHGVDILYTLARTPQWASQAPNDNTCPNLGPGACDPPLDVNSDGSGADDVWINWVTAVAQHSASQKTQGLTGISFYEIWNEWNTTANWVGTPAQLVRMEQDARCVVEGPPSGMTCNSNSTFPSGTAIDSSAKIVSPSPVGAAAFNNLGQVAASLNTYFSTSVGGEPGGAFSDAIGFHGYVGTGTQATSTALPCPTPEDVNTVISDMNGTLADFPSITAGKQLFNTEGGWSEADAEGFTDRDRQAAFLPRYLLLQESGNISRVYWFAWDSKQNSSLYDDLAAQPTLAATAYGEVNQWSVGATLSQACRTNSSTSTVWTCGFTRSGGYAALAVWDTGQDCTATSCPTTTFLVPAGGYTEYRDVAGNVTTLNGSSSVQIGAKPILLETSALP